MNAVQQLLTDHIDIWTAAETEKRTGRGRASGTAASVYGIKKLRELILELAVSGKLVPQDAKDEPASELIKRIQIEKSKLVAEGKIKKDKPLAAISETGKPFKLPSGWEWSTLSAITQVNPRNSSGDDLPVSFVTMTMIEAKFNSSHAQEHRLWKEIKQGFTHFAEGDIGIAKIAPCFENSKACVFSGLLNKIGAGTTELHVVRPINSTLAPRYVLAHLKSPQFLKNGEARMTGTAGQKRLPKEFVESNPFPLPPLAEQHRIVSKVDELMALCDQLEAQHSDAADAHEQLVSHLLGTLTQSQSAVDFNANWQRIAAHFDTLFTTEASIDALKQTLLQLAVMGKLVAQDANDEPASELLKQIQAEKEKLIVEGKIKKGKPLAAISDEDKPFLLPLKWQWARFPDLGEFGRGKSKHRPRNDPILFNPEIYPLIQTGEVARAENIITEYHSKYSDIGLAQSKMWPIGTLCITIAANIADSALLGFDACFPDSVVGFIPFKPITDTKYFLTFMKTARQNLLKFAPATAQKNINLEILESVLIPIPPLAEMTRIVEKIDELMRICDQLKSRIMNARQKQKKLADVLVEHAVAG